MTDTYGDIWHQYCVDKGVKMTHCLSQKGPCIFLSVQEMETMAWDMPRFWNTDSKTGINNAKNISGGMSRMTNSCTRSKKNGMHKETK